MISSKVRRAGARLSAVATATLLVVLPTSVHADDSNPAQDPAVFLGIKPDGYIGLISNYYSVLSALLTTADWVNNLVSPQPSLANLLQQMETQIIAVLKSDRDDNLTWAADGWTQRFHEIITNPQDSLNVAPSQSVEDLLNDASVAWTSMASIIAGSAGDGPDQAYRMAVPFITLRALYMAMLQYEHYSQAAINDRIQMAIQTEYQLVGTTDGACAISSGVNTEFDSRVFAAKYLGLDAGGYFCDVDTCLSSLGPAPGGTKAEDGYSCFEFKEPSQAIDLTCQLLFPPITTQPNTPSLCQTIVQVGGAACLQEANLADQWKFHHDFVTAMVRADLSMMLQQVSGSQTSDPRHCGQPLGLLPFGELCSGQSCAVDSYTPGMGATQSSTGSIFGTTGFVANWAVDGVTSPPNGGQVTLTNVETNPWWQVDLGFSLPIGQILIWPSDLSRSSAEQFVSSILIELNATSDASDRINEFGATNISQQSSPIVINANGYPGRYIRIQGVGHGALSLNEVQVLPFAQQTTMAFESAGGAWQVQNGGSAVLSTTSSEGAHSLSVTAAPGGWTPVVSQPLSSMQIRSVAKSSNLAAMSFALKIPTAQPKPSWIGAAQMYITSPSANIYNAYMGQVELTPLPKGQFVRLGFTIPSTALSAVKLDHSDVTFTIILNVNAGTSGWLLDDLEIGR